MTISTLQQPRQRLMSLDFFRGATVAAMILVNNPGDWSHIYPPLEHSQWNGCTPTDLIFPSFLFMVGVSIAYAIGSKLDNSVSKRKIIGAAAKRAIIIYLIHVFISLSFRFPHFNWSHFRIPGVLPRIAVVFFISVVLFVFCTPAVLLWIFGGILLLYYVLMCGVPVPGVGAPSLEPATNLAAWLDRAILTENHMWSGSKVYDPEGILSTLPAIATCLMGIISGMWLRRKDRDSREKAGWAFTWGLFSLLGGMIWNPLFPINKSLWTSSFVLYAGGISLLMLTLSYWLIDVQGRRKYIEPFLAFGANAITAYVAADLVLVVLGRIHLTQNGEPANAQTWLYQTFFTPYFSPVNASLAGAVVYVLLLLIPMWILYRKKIFIKV